MKFEEFPLNVPDFKKISKKLTALIDSFASAKSAKDVQTMIRDTRANLAAVVSYARDGQIGVASGMELAGTAEAEFANIARDIVRVSGLMQEISATVEELSAGGRRVVDSVKRVEEKSGETAGKAAAAGRGVSRQRADLASLDQAAGCERHARRCRGRCAATGCPGGTVPLARPTASSGSG